MTARDGPGQEKVKLRSPLLSKRAAASPCYGPCSEI